MPHKKLLYVPGLFSLLGLPILLFFMGPEDPVQKTVIRINLPADKVEKDGQLYFNKVNFYHTIKNKKLISVDIDDYSFDDRSQFEYDRKLTFVIREIERLQFTSDTNAVFRLRFGENNTYGQFIWAINMARIYDFKRYVFVDDDFYFLPNPPPVRMSGGEIYIDNVITIPPYTPPPSLNWWGLFTRRFNRWRAEVLFAIRHNHWLVIGFLLFILVPGFMGVRIQILRPT